MKVLGLSLTLLLALAPAALRAQDVTVASPAPQRLRVTTASEEASRHFWAGVADTRNLFFSRATTQFDKAIALDGNLGLARVFHGVVAPGLTAEQRKAEVNRAIATMTSATTSEMLVALAFREWVSNNRRGAQQLFRSAAEIMPGDPNIAYWAAQSPDGSVRNVPAFRAVTEKFPQDAPSYNLLAYGLWQSGDRPGALTAVQRYVELAPDQPNSYDSYGELLQWDGRYQEALTQYQRAAQIDSSFSEAYMGSADVLQLTGRGAEARRQIQLAITRAPSKVTAINARRALANSFLLDGMFREGMDQLSNAAREAQAANRRSLAAQIHLDIAIVDAVVGPGTTIASHLASSVENGGDPTTPRQLSAIAFAHGTAGDLSVARQAARKLADSARTNDEWTTPSRIANAVIYLRENKGREALAELSGAKSDDPIVRALRAEAYRAIGNLADARTIRTQLISDPQLDLSETYGTIARIRVTRIKVS